MRALAVILLAGCASFPSTPGANDNAPPPPASSPEAQLDRLWEAEIDDAVAGFTAVRPHLTTSERAALALFDAQLKGLEALAGSPTLAAVQGKQALIADSLGNPKAIADLAAKKAALDARTTALENAARSADTARKQAEARAAQAAADARLSEAASNLSRVAAGAIALGVLAFLFGHFLAIPRWVAASTIGLGTLTATTAPQLLAFFGSDNAQHLMLATFALLALAGTTSACIWLYRKLAPHAKR